MVRRIRSLRNHHGIDVPSAVCNVLPIFMKCLQVATNPSPVIRPPRHCRPTFGRRTWRSNDGRPCIWPQKRIRRIATTSAFAADLVIERTAHRRAS